MLQITCEADSKHGSETDTTLQQSEDTDKRNLVLNKTGDFVTVPSSRDIPITSRFVYCIDGNTTFPDHLNPVYYFPREPESWLVETSTAPTPMLTRSEQETEEAERRVKVAISSHGLQSQRRCLWQLPKLMVTICNYMLLQTAMDFIVSVFLTSCFFPERVLTFLELGCHAYRHLLHKIKYHNKRSQSICYMH